MPLRKTPLYNSCVRQGLSPVMQFLEQFPNQHERIKTLYRCRVAGYSVLLRNGKIFINGVVFTPEDLDNADLALATLSLTN